MEAKELRIGNWTEQGSVKSMFENGVHTGFGKCVLFKDIEPIPLTEEWKDKIKDNDDIFIEEHSFIIFTPNGEPVFTFEQYPFLHSIQNLYKALTFKELEIKTK